MNIFTLSDLRWLQVKSCWLEECEECVKTWWELQLASVCKPIGVQPHAIWITLTLPTNMPIIE